MEPATEPATEPAMHAPERPSHSRISLPAPPPRGGLRGLLDRALGALRDPNPILVKELRSTFRAPAFVRFLYLTTALVALMALVVGFSVAANDVPPAEVGQGVFFLFFVTSAFLICLIAPGFAASSIATEHRGRTYESLILSGMSPKRIVYGKFLAVYASFLLFLIALSPVVGIAFLFGGISPGEVLVGFLSMMVLLASAVSFGVAISARVKNPMIAILIAFVLFGGIAMFASGFFYAAAEEANREWHLGMDDPFVLFFYTKAFPQRIGEWDAWAFMILLPTLFFGLQIWFCLASAVAAVRPAAEDRSGPLKVWAVTAVGSAIVASAVLIASTPSHDWEEVTMACLVAITNLLLFCALLFIDEPPLPPRLWDVRKDRFTGLKRLLIPFGPGARRTMRFNVFLVAIPSLVLPLLGVAVITFSGIGASKMARFGTGYFVWGASTLVVLLFIASFGTYLRAVLRNALAARVLTSGVLLMLAILPLLFALIVDHRSFDHLDREPPLLALFSSVAPVFLTIAATDTHFDGTEVLLPVVPVVFYGLISAFFWAKLSARVKEAEELFAAKKMRFELEERARESLPAAPPAAEAPAADAAPAEAPSPEEPAAELNSEPAPSDEEDSEGGSSEDGSSEDGGDEEE